MVESLRSRYRIGSNQKQTNRPPLENKSPNSRAADRGKKRKERGGRRTGEEEGERGSALLWSRRRSRGGKEREEGLKKAPSTEGQAPALEWRAKRCVGGGHGSNKTVGELSNKTPTRVGILNQNAHLRRHSIRKPPNGAKGICAA